MYIVNLVKRPEERRVDAFNSLSGDVRALIHLHLDLIEYMNVDHTILTSKCFNHSSWL